MRGILEVCLRCPQKFDIYFKHLFHSKSFQVVRYCTSVVKMEEKWRIEKSRKMLMGLEEKRKHYYHKNFVRHTDVESWHDFYHRCKDTLAKRKPIQDDLAQLERIKINESQTDQLVHQVAMYKGDITQLEIDAVVNAANVRLKAGGGVDGAIHRAAGPILQQECDSLRGCPTGMAKVTGGYNLPAKYIIHTVGPQDSNEDVLRSCYKNCLSYIEEHRIYSIAFPCISTGIYGFPNRLAAHVALQTVREYLETNEKLRVVFCTFMPIDIEIYETLLQLYFPVTCIPSKLDI